MTVTASKSFRSLAVAGALAEGVLSWPTPTQTMKPWAINWWLGGAANEAGLEHQCAEMERAGFGGFNVVHIYQHRKPSKDGRPFIPDEICLKFMSDEWLEMWNKGVRIARRHRLGVDLSMCSGWCFGGPWVTREDAVSSLAKVHIPGPGGAGYHIDPFSPTAMRRHINRFEAAFGRNGTAERPRAFYHDSFEYYGARPKHGEDIDEAQIATFRVWTDWCRENGYLTRYQAHGSPANWLDLYSLSTVPETEMFGRRDKNRDILLSKFASSAAHVTGLKLVSAEACTWVDEHFHEKPCDVKLMLDQTFLAGINHIFYHGYCYSPVDAPWPGWCFYASLQMNPRNPLWREVATLNAYVTRCQSVFQTWQPDNDLLVKWDPDEFRSRTNRRGRTNRGTFMTIHNGDEWFHPFETAKKARELWTNGYQFDFVSERQLKANPKLKAKLDVARAKPSPFNKAKTGLFSTRWRDSEGRILYFVANHGKRTRAITGRFTVMDPMTGEIAAYRRYEVEPLQTVFVTGENLGVETDVAPRAPAAATLSCDDWRVTAVAGGPTLPAVTNLTQLASWTSWDENFSGTMRYETTLRVGGDVAQPVELDLGKVYEQAHVWLNGRDLGCRLLAPYRFVLPPGLLVKGENALTVEVTGLGANRVRWICRTNQPWKKFADTNFVNYDYRTFDAAKWRVVPCGLLGPVSLKRGLPR